MKKLLFILISLCLSTGLFAQLTKESVVIINDLNYSTQNKTMSCGIDTNGYLMAKATGLSALSINNSNTARAFCQYFDAPQDLTISGVDFYAWSSSLPLVAVTVNLYYANPLDSTPTGSVLASVVVNVDSTFGGGVLSVLKKTAVFPTAVTVNAPYVIEITNYSVNTVGFICSDYVAGDGQNEWLASADLFGSWIRSYNLSLGGSTLNADILLEPYISYDLTASFDEPTTTSCIETGDMIQFSEKNPLIENRMYSLAAYYGFSGLSYSWDFGDGSPVTFGDTVQHSYSNYGNYTVMHTDTLFGYNTVCIDTVSMIIPIDTLYADFSYSAAGLVVDYSDISFTTLLTGVSSWLWDFGDGNTSPAQNPTHTYATNGTYTVCLTVVDACGADSSCSSVSVISTSLGNFDMENNVQVYPNPVQDQLIIEIQELAFARIYSTDARLVKAVELHTGSNNIDVTSFANGIYILKIESSKSSNTYHFVKED
jgi:PKD repeat protein